MPDSESLAGLIEKFFLRDGKWELTVDQNPPDHVIGGRWLWLSDANYGFRPIDLAEAVLKDRALAMREPRSIESAPKDGSEILLLVGSKWRFGFWYQGVHPAFSYGPEADRKRGLYPRWAYWPTDNCGEFHSHFWCEPEIWMPIPVTPP